MARLQGSRETQEGSRNGTACTRPGPKSKIHPEREREIELTSCPSARDLM